MSRHQTTGQSLYINEVNESFENVAEFEHFGTTVTVQTCIHEEIKSRLNSLNACYHAVRHPLSFRLPSKNVNIKIYKTLILPVVLYGCEARSLT
jgi:hypothetical protein